MNYPVTSDVVIKYDNEMDDDKARQEAAELICDSLCAEGVRVVGNERNSVFLVIYLFINNHS
jgi:hypothetical protein